MRTLEHLAPERQQAIARETLDIYAPLAHRLGMGKVRGELEDLAFRYVDALTYEQVQSAVESLRSEGEEFLSNVEATLTDRLNQGRPGQDRSHRRALGSDLRARRTTASWLT